MKRVLCLLLISLSCAGICDDSLFVRRIAQLCHDGQWTLARSQIAAFLEAHPESPEGETLLELLGDLALRDKNYLGALEAYNKISRVEGKRSVRGKRWHALYQSQQFSQLYEEIAPCVSWVDDEGRFYFAECCFRQALQLLPTDREAACALCEQALPYYSGVCEQFASHAALACGEIYHILGRQKDAVASFRKLAQSSQSIPSETRLHATLRLAQYEPKEAIPLLEKLTKQGLTEAAAAWFHLLVHTDQWKKIIEERELFKSHLPAEKLPLFHYALGKTLMDARDYTGALDALTHCMKAALPEPYDKKALMLLILCCRECGALTTLEQAYELWTKRYPPDPKLSKARILAYRDAGQPKLALALLEKSEVDLPDERLRLKMAIAIQEKDHEALAALIEKGLAAPNLLEPPEKCHLRLLLAKTYLSLGRTQTAALHLKEHQQLFGPSAESHALLAFCGNDYAIIHGEEALRLNPAFEDLHLHLFNAYLEKGNETAAAAHLTAVIANHEIPLENRLWLAHYWKKHGEPAARILPLLEPLLTAPERFEKELILLAELYVETGAQKKALSLLEKLPSAEAKLARAHLLCTLGEQDKALSLFQALEHVSDKPTAYEAKLAVARLLFAQLPKQTKKKRNPEVVHILRRLEDLKLCKRLATEPIHLEAALDYALFKAQLADPAEFDAVYLKELLAIREEFTIQDDLASRDYHGARKTLPEKDSLYQAYMRYLDASLYLAQGHLAKKEGNTTFGEAKEKAAYALFVSISQREPATTKYLVEKASRALYCNSL